MHSFIEKYLSYKPLCIVFTIAAMALLATVALTRVPIDAMSARVRARTVSVASSSVASSVSAREKLRLERAKRDAVKKASLELRQRLSQPRLNSRFLRTYTGTTILRSGAGGAESYSSHKYDRAKCGDKLVIEPEMCDDGGVSGGDGCSSTCAIEAGYICTTGQPSYCWDQCGDGKVSAREKCDDGNDATVDGCDLDCRIEPGYNCSGEPSVCTHP